MFNHQARWDRKLPHNLDTVDQTRLRMLCLMTSQGQIIPKAFYWKKDLLTIIKINLSWQDKEGRETTSFFSVETSQGTYEISFSHQSLTWRLRKLISP